MKDNHRETLVEWLKDAHGMEKTSIKLLDKQANRLKHYPEMERRVRQHAEESKQHASRIEQCVKDLGSDVSTIKESIGTMAASVGAIGNASASDEVVKNALGDYAFEHFEIACYRSLVAAAEKAGETGVASTCREILKEEQRMAEWVDSNLDSVTQQYLSRDATDAPSKR